MRLLFAAVLTLLASWSSSQVLTPSYFNLAAKKKIVATSTCGVGVSSPELFCKLTGANPDKGDEVTGFEVIHGQLCDHCDPNHPNKTHRPEYAVDGTELWWQSPPLSRGLQYNEVNLTIDLGQEFHVAYILIKMANSPRPGVFALERSKDFGLTWQPWQFFADTPSDCQSYFGHIGYSNSISRDDSVICTTEYSKVVPLEGGEIVVSLVNNRPSSQNFSYSASLQDWTKATNIRLRLLRTKTLLGHLMAVAKQDPTITRRYFYSIRDISIGGQCVCNGHARSCNLTDPRRPDKVICNCEHNTCGDHCEQCCPGFIQKPWRPATLDTVNECEPCQCHGHSHECNYDEQVAKDRLSMDVRGRMEGGGVCRNCQHNTEGINCEKCKFGYYRPYGVPLDAPNGCRRCNCDSSFSSGGCEEGSGMCQCKPEFAGVDCSRCNVGYYDYPQCKPCRCNVNGTERQQCDPGYGHCPCKPNFDGPTCDQCAAGYYGPECKPCDCDDYGSQEKRCDRRSGQCICRPRFGGRTCGQCANGYFNYPRCEPCNCDQAGSSEEVCDKNNGACLCKENFAGTRCEKCLAGFFRFPHCISCNCNEHGVQVNDCNLDGQCFCKPNFMGRTCDQCAPGYYRYPDCIPCNCNPDGSSGTECDLVTGQCRCKSSFEGAQCDSCKANYYNFPLCEECNCHHAGAKEVPGFPLGGCGSHAGGKLCECKERATGKYCDTCKPNYWNLDVYNPEGCEDCGCDVRGTVGGSKHCDPHSGQCLCKPYVTGRKCDQCQDGTFNLQEYNVFGCQPCKCDVGGSQNMVCDKSSGQCNCKPRITGKNCESPIMTHYYPELHHNKYELEDGRTPGGGLVRYGFDQSVFPGFSWKGYAIFSELQDEVLVDVDVKKAGLYKILYRYANHGRSRVNGDVAVTPDHNVLDGKKQTSSAFFHAQRSNFTYATSEGGDHGVFALNPGRWTVSLRTPEAVFVDYLVLLPSAYYEATVLKDKTLGPCTLPPTPAPCKHYIYLNLGGHSKTDATRGHDGWSKGPTQVFEDRRVLHQLNVTDMAYLNSDQNMLILNVSVPRPGRYVFLVTYFTPDLKRTQEVEVDVMTSSGRSTGHLKLLNCPHSSLCRQFVADGSHDVQVFQVDGHYATLTFSGRGDIELAIDSVYAISVDEWQLSHIDPKFKCIHQDSKCIDTFTSGSITGIKVDFDVTKDERPPGVLDPNVRVVKLDSLTPTAEIRVKITPGRQVLVPHYYQPTSPGFDVDVQVEVGDRTHSGTFRADHCPNIHGCPAVVNFEGGVETVDLNNPDVRITFSSSKPLWLDYVTIVPYIYFSDNTLKEHEEVDTSTKFVTQCGGVTYLNDQGVREMCKEGVYSVVIDFNEGALKCDCNPEGSTSFTCDPYGGQCNCRPHVIGRTCSQCVTGYWGFPDCRECQCPSKVCDPLNGRCICPPRVTGARCDTCLPRTFGFDAVVGCEDCDCDLRGVQDDNMDCDQVNGQCRCKPNVAGRRCDKCNVGHYGFPWCNACSCDRRGTENQVCDQYTSECLCKKNVHGQDCSECVPSTFHLDQSNPLGCTECFCSGVSNQCTSSSWRYKEVSHPNGWVSITEKEFAQETGILDDFVVTTPRYWKASDDYLREVGVTAYGGKIEYEVQFWKEGPPSEIWSKSNVVLLGEDGAVSASSMNEDRSDRPLRVQLQVVEWKFLNAKGMQVDREEFLRVLVKPRGVYVRLTTDIPTRDAELRRLSLDVADPYGSGEVANSVEQCQCPPNHQGTSCQLCAPGYYRPKHGQYQGTCIPCDCNNRAESCNGETGECLRCRDNFEGPQCSACRKGYYHDLYADTCKICSCPHPDEANNFATSCEVTPNGEMIGCHCLPGYSGRQCERCDVGFWGDPMSPGGRCEKCNCHNNVNERDPHSCDHRTGVCNNCLHETGGDHCERCRDGYYGDAILAKNCRRCECDPLGTDHCDHRTGACVCKPNVHGHLCNQCMDGAFGFHTGQGCEMCECGIASLNSLCDAHNGQCQCRPGVTGRKCDRCQEGYWNYEPRGCQPCNCQSKGAVSCDPVTGQCRCLPGVTGPNCDQCLPKWILIPDHGCKECDNCVHILLDDIDLLHSNVTQMKRELDSVSVGLQTIKRLESINRTYLELEPRVRVLVESPKVDFTSLKEKLRSVQELANEVASNSDRVERNAHFTESDAGEAKKQANNLYDSVVKRAMQEVNEAIVLVQNILNTISGSVSASNIDDILKRSEEMLAEIKRNDFGKNEEEARNELERATDTLRRAKALMDNVNSQLNKTSSVNVLINEVLKKLQDLLTSSSQSLRHSAEVSEINLSVLRIKNDVVDLVNKVKNTQKDIKDCLDESETLISEAKRHFGEAKLALNDLELEANNFRATLKDLEDKHDRLNSENDLLKPQVEEAARHADQLNQQAFTLQSLIDNTKVSADSALRASSAYESISKAIYEALNASQQAIAVAEEAVRLSSGLAESSRQSRKDSDDILTESRKISSEIELLKNRLDEVRRVLKDISEIVITEKITELVKGLENLPSEGYAQKAQEATVTAQNAQTTADSAKERIDKIMEQLEEDEKRIAELPNLLHEANTNIRSAESSLNKLSGTQPEMVNLISQLTTQSDMLLQLEMDLKRGLDQLKNQIGVARDTAHLIRIGVNFTKDSSLQVRNIENMASAGLNSEVSLYFRTVDRNGLLYYIGSDVDPVNEYMVLELVDGQPVFRINLGSGETVLDSKTPSNDDGWHHVRVVRNGRFISMELTKDGEILRFEDTIKGPEIVMNLDNAKFYIGGVPDHAIAQLHSILKYPKFVGSIEGVHYDNIFIGLWNFVQAKDIRGALVREIHGSKDGVMFGGDGYLILSKGRQSDVSNSNILFTFATFDSEALLLYIGNKEKENPEYILIQLVDGQVHLKVNLGSGETSLFVEGKKNDGKPHEVQFKRKGNLLLFKVDQKTPTSGLLKTPGMQITFESTQEIYFGGFKGEHNVPHATNKGFKGCISALTVGTQAEKDLLDFIEVKNVKPGCHKISRVASFWSLHADNSYILVDDSFDASIDFSISFKFRTDQTDALLFYLADGRQERALSLAVADGKLVTTSVDDSGANSLTSDDDVNDGKWHFVLIEKIGNDLSVNIDDVYRKSFAAGRGTSSNSFYLGGLPNNYSVLKANAASTQQFTGCLGDLSVNWRPVDFSALSYSGTTLSSCHFVDRIPFQPPVVVTVRPPVPPIRPPKAECALPLNPSEDGGVRFGYNSRLEYNKIPAANSLKSNYSLEFKTTEDSGVLYYVSSADHVDFVGIYLKDGRVNVAFNSGGGLTRISSRMAYNDGMWHKVRFTRMNKNGLIEIDDKEDLSGTSPGATSSIEVVPPHFVGGLDPGSTTKASRNLEGKVLSFVGCMRNIAHNGLDFGAADVKFEVSDCSGTTEDGTFFYADKSHVILDRNYSVPLNFKISFQMRPRVLNAVLLSIHNVASGDYLVIQLISGELHFSMDNGRRQDVETVHVPVPKNQLCDGQWHSVTATKAKNLVVLQVDNVVVAPGRGEEGWAHTNTQDELYFGGVPDGSPNPGLKTRDSFVGCVKDLKIDDVPVSMDSVETSGRIERNFCPSS